MYISTIRAGPAKVLISSSIGDAPLNFTCWDVIVWHGVDHALSNEPETGLLCFVLLFERYDRYNDPIKYKSGHNFSEKKKEKKASLTFVCTCSSNMRLKFQIEGRKIKRGIAVIPLVRIIICLIFFFLNENTLQL